jgi:predicted ATPase/DNA-binding SARP family transcriptional activator
VNRFRGELVIRLFGAFEAQVNGTPLPHLRTRKDAWVLALLALRAGRPVDRAWLAGTLWPDGADPMASLRKSLLDLRRALGPEAGRLYSPTPRTLVLDLSGAEVDALAFDAAVAQDDGPALEEAVKLYRGPLLEVCGEEWVVPERQSREHAYLEALDSLARAAMARGGPAAAEHYLRRAVAVDPLRESTQRALMQALAARGDVAAAIAAYREFCRVLARDLEAQPDPETQTLFRSLRSEIQATNAGAASCEAPPHNLPAPLTRFIGREREITELRPLLTPTRDADTLRLITFSGVGGCGKTRLALQVAASLTDAFPDGVWLVELASLADAALVPQAIATALRLREQPDHTLTETLAGSLRPRALLLVLDNCEHLVAACAALAHRLLTSCPHLRILATSRELLGIDGEYPYPVPPLSLPEAPGGAKATDGSPLHHLSRSEAVQLFVERARTAVPRFQLTEANASAVATICRRLDGLPLAIELAAARMRIFSTEQIAARLDDRFHLLAGGSRVALPRHRTLRALIDWSYDLLSEPERGLLRRLSVFAGGWTLEAAEAVCADDDRRPPTVDDRRPIRRGRRPAAGGHVAVLDLLTRLGEKSLVAVEQEGDGPRYLLLETVREYARERLVEVGEEPAVRWRHLVFFARWAEEAAPCLRGEEGRVWMNRFEAAHDNLRAALAWAREVGAAPDGRAAIELGLKLVTGLGPFWWRRGYLAESRAHSAAMLAVAGVVATPMRAQALDAAAAMARLQRDCPAARMLHEEALAVYRDLADQRGIAGTLTGLATIAGLQGDVARARQLLTESLAIGRAMSIPAVVASALNELGLVEISARNYDAASAVLQESLATSQALGDQQGIATALNNLGIATLAEGRADEAHRLFGESLRMKWDTRLWSGIPWTLAGLAGVAAAQEQRERAARLFGAAAAGQESMGSSLPPDFAECVAALREAIGESAFAAAWAEGAAMTLPQAVGYALAENDDSSVATN